MKLVVILALCIFWITMAYREYQRGDMMLAGVFLVVGIALTASRISRWRG
jgi:hypothetical protein